MYFNSNQQIEQNSHQIGRIRNCDFRRVSYQIILRGIREAEYRSLVADGLEALEYRKILLELEDIIEDFDLLFDEEGIVLRRHTKALREAISRSSLLIFQEQWEINRLISVGLIQSQSIKQTNCL